MHFNIESQKMYLQIIVTLRYMYHHAFAVNY